MEIHIYEKANGDVYWVQKGGRAGLAETESLESDNEEGSREHSAVRASTPALPPQRAPQRPRTSAESGTKENSQCGESIIFLSRISPVTAASRCLPGCHHLTTSRAKCSLAGPQPTLRVRHICSMSKNRYGASYNRGYNEGRTRTSRNPFWNPPVTH